MLRKSLPSEKADAEDITDIGELPAELDNETVIFSYGSLLEHETLRGLLKNRGEFKVLETSSIVEAAVLAKANPADIVILRNVRLENVRVSIVTETMLRRWYQIRGGNLQELIDSQITTREIPQAVFLYARPAKLNEKGRTLNGGLICNFSKAELSMLDKYEFEPVLKRMRAPELKIGERTYAPKYITFYAGTESLEDMTPEEKAERARILNLNRKPGYLSPQAKWQKLVRRR
jgi:hypothetical protein